jgi:hypothetical protein
MRHGPSTSWGFAALVEELLRDPLRRGRMAEDGRAFAAEWDTRANLRRVRVRSDGDC